MGGTEGAGLAPTGSDGVGIGVMEGRLGEGRAGGLTAGADGTGREGSGGGDGTPGNRLT